MNDVVRGIVLAVVILGVAGCSTHRDVEPPSPPASSAAGPTSATSAPSVAAPGPPAPTSAPSSPATSPAPRETTAPPAPSVPAPPPAPAAPAPPKTAAVPKPEAKPAPAPPPLDLAGLEKRLRDTSAIGVFTKLSLKNQVDDLIAAFKAYHEQRGTVKLDELRERYNGLMLKVLSLLQRDDPPLARDLSASREALWAVLVDPAKFAKVSGGG
jgi:hypothetical protein